MLSGSLKHAAWQMHTTKAGLNFVLCTLHLPVTFSMLHNRCTQQRHTSFGSIECKYIQIQRLVLTLTSELYASPQQAAWLMHTAEGGH
jgi:hypothetical protein